MPVHKVKRGDTPFLIAKKYSGDGARHAELLELNPSFKSDQTKSGWRSLVTGDQITVPDDWENPANEAPTEPPRNALVELPRGSRFAPEPTVVTASEVYAALERAWGRLFNDAPGQEALALCIAQWALETGWGKSCFNYNLGNMKAVEGDGLDHTYYPTWEVLPRAEAHGIVGKAEPRVKQADGIEGPNAVLTSTDDANNTAVVWFYPDHYMCRFRAFRSLDEGAEEYLKALFHKYKRAWVSLATGNPSTFAETLKAYKYFTAPLDGPKGYRTALVSVFNRVQAQLKNAA